MTLVELVNERLHQMFVQIADDIGTDKVDLNLTQDETAAVPLALFSAEQVLRSAFERFVTSGEVPWSVEYLQRRLALLDGRSVRRWPRWSNDDHIALSFLLDRIE